MKKPMNKKHLLDYLKDHFAGSVAALELLNHLVSSQGGKIDEQFFIQIRREVQEDQKALEGLLSELDAGGGVLRNTTAFLGEKMARLKLLLEDPGGGQLARLEKLEALALGIEGKSALWHSLLALGDDLPISIDLASLVQRAADQRQRVESLRVAAAREAFLNSPSS
jgi:hypothetical protein